MQRAKELANYFHGNKVSVIMRYFSRNFYIIRVDNVAHYTKDFVVRGFIILIDVPLQ